MKFGLRFALLAQTKCQNMAPRLSRVTRLQRTLLPYVVPMDELLMELMRELKLSGALPYVINMVSSQEDPQARVKVMRLGAALATLPYPVLVGGADRRAIGALLGSERPSLTVMVHRTSLDERLEAWTETLSARNWDTDKAQEIAERFYSVGGTTLDQILDRAEAESGGREPEREAIWAAARECSRPEFRGLAQHIVPRYRMEDLILTDKIKLQLSPGAVTHLAATGYDPVYGARPVKRAVQRQLETPLSKRLLAGDFVDEDAISVDFDEAQGALTFAKKE